MINRRFALGVVFFTALMDSIGFGIILPVTPTLLMEVSDQGLSSSAVYGGCAQFFLHVSNGGIGGCLPKVGLVQ